MDSKLHLGSRVAQNGPGGHKQVLRAKSDIKISDFMRKFIADFSVDLVWFGLERAVKIGCILKESNNGG